MHRIDEWEKIYQFILACSNIHNPYDYCGKIVSEMHLLVPYDQARIIFLDENGKINASLLYGVK